jgi:hypothetical protein
LPSASISSLLPLIASLCQLAVFVRSLSLSHSLYNYNYKGEARYLSLSREREMKRLSLSLYVVRSEERGDFGGTEKSLVSPVITLG